MPQQAANQSSDAHRETETLKDVERLATFSDAIFAFSMTVLAIEIKVPVITGDPVVELPKAMIEQFPHFVSFIIGFLVVAMYWSGHHRIFRHIKRVDGRLIWINIFLLMFIAFMPVATGYLGEYNDVPMIAALFACVIIAVSLFDLILLRYAASHGFLDRDLQPRLIQYYQWRSIVPTLVSILSILIAYTVSASAAELSWALIWVINILVSRQYRDIIGQVYGNV